MSSDPDSPTIDLSYNGISIHTLIDCGASDCFIDPHFVSKHRLPISLLKNPIRLRLIDGSYAKENLTRFADLNVLFPSGERVLTRFLLTPLESSVSAVLGYRWLRRHNPLIDWTTNQLSFRTRPQETSFEPVPPSSTISRPSESSDDTPLRSAKLRTAITEVDVRFINGAAFASIARTHPLSTSIIHVSDTSTAALRAAAISEQTSQEFDELRQSVPSEYHDYLEVFSKQKADTLPEHRPYDHKIDLIDDATPPLGPIYSLSETEQLALREYLSENLSKGFIKQSQSPCGAPILFVKKKDGSLRLCVDYRGLNRITRKDRYPLPLIPDLLDRLRTAKRFTKLDLRGAYNLVRIAPGDEWKTAFRTRYGSFEYNVMPFGLCNAPATFQRFMNEVFADLLDISVVVYLDDILIYSDDPTSHTQHVREVLERLKKHGLFCQSSKCEFSTDTTEFLGFVCTSEGIKMDESKIDIIKKWPRPRNVRDVQSFLGFANFYRRFIYDYSQIVIPLTRLTRKSTRWEWTEPCQSAFDSLKLAFTSAPVLTHWQPELRTIVETDASDYAIAAIISIENQENELHPIAFHSRTLSPTELNYDTHDKELLAIFEAFKVWRHYLEGSPHVIDVVTDHKNLEYFSTTKMLTRRQARWSEYLSSFNLLIRFRPGKLGAKPDALTRRPDVYPKRGDRDYAGSNPHNFRPVFGSEQLATSLRATFLAEPVLRAATLIDLEALRTDILEGLKVDAVAQEHISKIQEGSDTPKWSISESGFLLFEDRIYVPDYTPARGNLRLRLLQERHDHPTAGHFGQTKTIELIRREYTWPQLRIDVQKFVKSCIPCSRAKVPRHKPYGLLKPLPIPSRPWDSISMDFIDQLPLSNSFTSILVIIDRLSKQGIFIPTVNECTSQDLARLFLIHVFSKHGIPNHITSDRGPEFTSHFFKSLGSLLDIKLHFTSGYHPEGDGQTERVNQTLEQYLRIYCNFQQDNWSELLPLAEFAYNNAPNATTGISPFFANKGYHPNLDVHTEQTITSLQARAYALDLHEVHESLREQIKNAQERYEVAANRNRLPAPHYRIGDKVYVKSTNLPSRRPSKKLDDKNLGPWEIIGQHGPNAFTLKLPNYMSRVHPVFHVAQLEPAFDNPYEGRTEPAPEPTYDDEGNAYFPVAEILDSKYDYRFKCQLRYFVRWEGYTSHEREREWVSAEDYDFDEEIVIAFHTQYPDKPGPAKIDPTRRPRFR